MLNGLWQFLRHKSLDLFLGALPKVYSLAEENNILGLYDAHFLLTKQEQLVGILQIEGLSATAMLAKDLEGYFEHKKNALEQLQGVVLRIYTQRQRVQLQQNQQINNPYAQTIINHFESKDIYENTYYLILETTTNPIKGFFEKKKLKLTTSTQKSHPQESYAHKVSLLTQNIAQITHALKDFKPTRLSSTQALNFYARFINGVNLPLKPSLGFLEDSYIATNIHFHKDHYIQDHNGALTYKRILGVKAYGSKTITSIALATLLHQEKELEIIFSIEPLGLPESLSFVQEKIRLSWSALVRAELQNYHELIKAKRLCLQKCALNIILSSPNLPTLNQQTQEVLSLLSNEHLIAVVETLGLKPAYFSFFPGRLNLNPRLRHQSTQALACLIVFEKPNRGFKSNSWGPMPLSVFKNLDHSPYLFNFHNQEVKYQAHSTLKANGHTMIIGATGAGKTTLMGFLMMSALKYSNLNILALDRAYGLFSYTHYFGGIYNSGDQFSINPLSLPFSQQNQDFLHAFYAAMLNVPLSSPHQADIQERNAILKALKSLYATLPPQSFNLQDFKEALTHTPKLTLSLESYLNNPLFNALEDSLEFKTPITTINMDAISPNPKDLGLLAYYIFYKIFHLALQRDQGFLLFVDEFKSYAQNEVLNEHINTLITQARKANGVVVLALQDINQLHTIKNAQSFVKNMGTLLFYPQKNMDSTALSRDFGIQLSSMEKHFLENTPVHAHQILVKNMGDGSSNIIDISLNSLGPYLPIFSSNPSHAQHLQTLMQDHPHNWREVLLQENNFSSQSFQSVR
ncbi:VirB4 homolog (VirB4) [Helicobacter bizzozeronii]|uniref:VirB4 family type IV secretion/conjugal transfer ATPase n=1 Tax=Helicobacter bizzozeronii TaxID=56877 RepID=UPI00244D8E8A|nr:FtsK/SpoIIIE domain-containing protein [Helicobacter bizzozeronii]GMB93409.1 VirB4 homolog (VirB4) [Helicobacter bizzozeronii]